MDDQVNHSVHKCIVDEKEYLDNEGKRLGEIDSTIAGHIQSNYNKANESDFICNQHLLEYQVNRINQLLRDDEKRNQKIDRKLTKTLQKDDYQIHDINDALNQTETFGQKVADGVAKFGGSWGFIFSFMAFLLIWMAINIFHIFGADFDEYPFILLNLALSCVAAIQAPIIMMSQNRSTHRDRLDADNDYHVNLKSENELRILHAKLDQLSQNQMPHHFEIKQLQLEVLGEIREELDLLQNERIVLDEMDAKDNQNQSKPNPTKQ